jgi:hypothetical protein
MKGGCLGGSWAKRRSSTKQEYGSKSYPIEKATKGRIQQQGERTVNTVQDSNLIRSLLSGERKAATLL